MERLGESGTGRMRKRKPFGRLALKIGRGPEVIRKEVSSCLPFTDANQWGLRTEDDAQWGELLEQVISKAYDYGLDSQTVLDNITTFISANQTPTSGTSSTRGRITHFPIWTLWKRARSQSFSSSSSTTLCGRATFLNRGTSPCRCGLFTWTASLKSVSA